MAHVFYGKDVRRSMANAKLWLALPQKQQLCFLGAWKGQVRQPGRYPPGFRESEVGLDNSDASFTMAQAEPLPRRPQTRGLLLWFRFFGGDLPSKIPTHRHVLFFFFVGRGSLQNRVAKKVPFLSRGSPRGGNSNLCFQAMQNQVLE